MPAEESVSHAMTVYLEWAVELPLSTRCCLSRCGKRPFADFAERPEADIQCEEPAAKARRSRHRPLF
jgi:hypothetical protein